MVREQIFKIRVETNYGQRHFQGVLPKRKSQVKWLLVFRSGSELISRLCWVLHELALAFLFSSTFVHSSCSSLSSTRLSYLLSPTQMPTLWMSLWLRCRNALLVSHWSQLWYFWWDTLQTSLCLPCTPVPPWDHKFLPDSGLGHPLSDLCAPPNSPLQLPVQGT